MQAVCSQSLSAGDDLLFYRCRVINEQKVLDSGGENGMLSHN